VAEPGVDEMGRLLAAAASEGTEAITVYTRSTSGWVDT
jgi:hypothetical protein